MSSNMPNIDIPLNGVGAPIEDDGIELIPTPKTYEDAVADAIKDIPDLPVKKTSPLKKSISLNNRNKSKIPHIKAKTYNPPKGEFSWRKAVILATLSLAISLKILNPIDILNYLTNLTSQIANEIRTSISQIATIQINKFQENVKYSLVEAGLGTKSGRFGNINLTEEAKKNIAKKININDKMQIYILSLCISDLDMNEIIALTGMPGGYQRYFYLNGFEATDTKPAGMVYEETMSKLLQKKIKENPDYLKGKIQELENILGISIIDISQETGRWIMPNGTVYNAKVVANPQEELIHNKLDTSGHRR